MPVILFGCNTHQCVQSVHTNSSIWLQYTSMRAISTYQFFYLVAIHINAWNLYMPVILFGCNTYQYVQSINVCYSIWWQYTPMRATNTCIFIQFYCNLHMPVLYLIAIKHLFFYLIAIYTCLFFHLVAICTCLFFYLIAIYTNACNIHTPVLLFGCNIHMPVLLFGFNIHQCVHNKRATACVSRWLYAGFHKQSSGRCFLRVRTFMQPNSQLWDFPPKQTLYFTFLINSKELAVKYTGVIY